MMSYQREYGKRLALGIVGVGSHAYRNLLPALNFLPVELKALCDLNLPLVEKTARQYGVVAPVFVDDKRMYESVKLDAVLLCAGPGQHPKLARRALEAGVAVWMEKPPAMRT